MTSRQKNTLSDAERQVTIHALLQEQMRLAIRQTFITVLEEEVNGFIQAAPYQRTPERQDYRNGHYERNLVTTQERSKTYRCPGQEMDFERSCLSVTSVARRNWMKLSAICLYKV